MPVKVIDASALAALVFAEPEADKMAQAMAGAKLIAPSLLPYELASVCLKKIHRSPQQAKLLKTAFHMAKRLADETVAVEMGDVIDLARATNLTTYDACYLWLAKAADADLITLDKQLLEAC
jgi:predicted nucleic acid-binding protein